MSNTITLRSRYQPERTQLEVQHDGPAGTTNHPNGALLTLTVGLMEEVSIALHSDDRVALAAFLAAPEREARRNPAPPTGPNLKLNCSVDPEDTVLFECDEDDLSIEVVEDGESTAVCLSPDAEARLVAFLTVDEVKAADRLKETLEAEAEDATARQAAECSTEELAREATADLSRQRRARLEDVSWPANPIIGQRELDDLSTVELLQAVQRRFEVERTVGSSAAAGREFSLAITALEDAQARFTRGLARKRGVFKPADLERPLSTDVAGARGIWS